MGLLRREEAGRFGFGRIRQGDPAVELRGIGNLFNPMEVGEQRLDLRGKGSRGRRAAVLDSIPTVARRTLSPIRCMDA